MRAANPVTSSRHRVFFSIPPPGLPEGGMPALPDFAPGGIATPLLHPGGCPPGAMRAGASDADWTRRSGSTGLHRPVAHTRTAYRPRMLHKAAHLAAPTTQLRLPAVALCDATPHRCDVDAKICSVFSLTASTQAPRNLAPNWGSFPQFLLPTWAARRRKQSWLHQVARMQSETRRPDTPASSINWN